ncbi:MAG: phospho-N-acetylmuramoyl-pentapeptide-transferase [Clostridia bacterium]|nr:phospho-N-acetylmuramoyl-pentapeptide-transferase [Clostridia bacterium]
MGIYGYFGVMTCCTFVLTALITRKLIPILKSKKMGQKILDIGPRWHKSKEGTPQMGGLAFFCVITLLGGVLLLCAALGGAADRNMCIGGALALFLGTANGFVGMFDDWRKLQKKQNEGLTASQKYLLQVLCAGLYLAGMKAAGLIDGVLRIPFTSVELDLGFGYFFIALILITGIVNAVNLTDGIDGLLCMISFVAGGFLLLAAIKTDNIPLCIVASGIIGGVLGFLVYNYHPARVFMGDTGSLYLGGLFAGTAFMLAQPFLIVVYGIIFIVEAASVIIQVGCYKLTKKRVFKMAPIHHHFEMCGWGELKIGYVFAAVTAVACVISYFAI